MKTIILFSLLIILNSCSSEIKRMEKPLDLIPKDSMIIILKDLTLIESYIKDKQPINFYNSESVIKSGEVVLKKYNLDTLRFGKSFDYYASFQKEIESIYSAIIDSVNKEALILKSK